MMSDDVVLTQNPVLDKSLWFYMHCFLFPSCSLRRSLFILQSILWILIALRRSYPFIRWFLSYFRISIRM